MNTQPSTAQSAPLVSVVTPSIPPRAALLEEAKASVCCQTVDAHHLIAVDDHGEGEAITRNRALFDAATPWVAFLDDDDWLYPQHLERLLACAEATGADLVYPWFDVHGGTDPLAAHEGLPFDPGELRLNNYVPVTTLVRTDLAHAVGGFPQQQQVDWGFLIRLLDAGATFVHLAERTWCWRHWSGNTSGRTWK